MIRLCTEKEGLAILNEPQNIKRIGVVSEHMKYQPWIAEDGDYRIMFVFWHVNNKTFEVHIASPRDSIIKSRQLAKEIMNWLFKHGASRIITTCPKGKISNFVTKIGMSAYKVDGENTCFEALSWL
jgi:hypothetical protein